MKSYGSKIITWIVEPQERKNRSPSGDRSSFRKLMGTCLNNPRLSEVVSLSEVER